MRSLEEILDTSPEKPAFSNSTSWDMWADQWCLVCVKDINEDCPLIMAGFLGFTPAEWVRVGLQDYECTEFEPREEQK